MTGRRRQLKGSPSVRRVHDEAWASIKPILDRYDPPKLTGRRRIDQRAALDAVVYQRVTGDGWNRLPGDFPDDSSVHRTYQRWVRLGVFDRIWPILVEQYPELGGIDSPSPPRTPRRMRRTANLRLQSLVAGKEGGEVEAR